ncbi:CBS domain-containing protein, partial [Bacillus haynesii]|nr:CBS domain-containing protein [Bacillus haynesii]
GRLVGIVSLGDLSVSHADEKAGEALSEISKTA